MNQSVIIKRISHWVQKSNNLSENKVYEVLGRMKTFNFPLAFRILLQTVLKTSSSYLNESIYLNDFLLVIDEKHFNP